MELQRNPSLPFPAACGLSAYKRVQNYLLNHMFFLVVSWWQILLLIYTTTTLWDRRSVFPSIFAVLINHNISHFLNDVFLDLGLLFFLCQFSLVLATALPKLICSLSAQPSKLINSITLLPLPAYSNRLIENQEGCDVYKCSQCIMIFFLLCLVVAPCVLWVEEIPATSTR